MDVLTERTNKLALDDDEVDYTFLQDDMEDDDGAARVSLRRMSTSVAATSKSNENQMSRRRRRRSSARFLNLHGDDDDDDDNNRTHNNNHNNKDRLASTQDLGQVYQNAIRMNAENKINGTNSWNLNLIDHMDRFLGRPSYMAPSSSSTSRTASTSASAMPALEDTLGPITGINFTKASCTLDASVKIYSYRVDDVHLTSYKVLANLNRTDYGKSQNNNDKDDSSDTTNNNESGTTSNRRTGTTKDENRRGTRGNTDTLETNVANINIHKLDAAFDIDPLFHKMSKTFDEGGAKGLLLANLGVSNKGCNIVFDSTLEEVANNDDESDTIRDQSNSALVDVSSLQGRIEVALAGQMLDRLPLVPQLAMLREEYRQLDQDGFLEPQVPTSDRYAAPREVEIEADRSIHIEAIERSRASHADIGRSLLAERDDDNSSFGDDDDEGDHGAGFDVGGGADNDDDDFQNPTTYGDGFLTSSIHDGNHRFSSESFQTTFESRQPTSQATILLDAIASGSISGSQSNYEYFSSKALESIQGNNQWAGSAHWRKIQSKRTTTTKSIPEVEGAETATATTKKKRTKTKTSTSGGLLIDISKLSVHVDALLKKPPKAKKGAGHPLQMTKAVIIKATNNENLLPLDVGINAQSLTSLFSRPNTNVMDLVAPSAPAVPVRQVGFGGTETWGYDDNSYGDDDQGGSFGFGGGYDGGDDFHVPELEGIRKVEKVRVGYATVAKQVDVKRLKADLWLELERTFEERNMTIEAAVSGQKEMDTDDDSMDTAVKEAVQFEHLQVEVARPVEDAAAVAPISFQQTVREMQDSQSQMDVTLPFYFICILHLANEKGLALESTGLEDFMIRSG